MMDMGRRGASVARKFFTGCRAISSGSICLRRYGCSLARAAPHSIRRKEVQRRLALLLTRQEGALRSPVQKSSAFAHAMAARPEAARAAAVVAVPQ